MHHGKKIASFQKLWIWYILFILVIIHIRHYGVFRLFEMCISYKNFQQEKNNYNFDKAMTCLDTKCFLTHLECIFFVAP